MKKSVIFIVAAVVANAGAQEISISKPGSASVNLKANTYYRMNRDNTQSYSQDIRSKYYGVWLRDSTWNENSTTADGEASFQRGELNEDVSIWINNEISGRLYEVTTQWAYTNLYTTYVYGEDDPAESSVTGYSCDRSASGQRTADNAVTIYTSQVNAPRYVGSWYFDEGNYYGGEGYSGIVARQGNAFTCYGASFVAGDQTTSSSAASGAYLAEMSGDVYIDNETDWDYDRFQGGTFTTVYTKTGGGTYYSSVSYNGGDGLFVGDNDTDDGETQTMGITILGGDFYGSQNESGSIRGIEYTEFDTYSATATARGGRGAYLGDASEGVIIESGNFIGGDAGWATVAGDYSSAYTVGGEGAVLVSNGTVSINNAVFTAGKSYSATVEEVGQWDAETQEELTATAYAGSANASGASGLLLYNNGTTTISNITTTGSAGSVASAQGESSTATANGGSGLLAYNTAVVINGGTFTGANGGTAKVYEDSASASACGGAGVWQINSSLTINGGTFSGGDGGTVNGDDEIGNLGVVAQNANLTITENSGETLINGNVLINNSSTSAKTVSIQAGTIDGDIYSIGSGTINMSISSAADYSGSFIQSDGIVNVNLTDSDQSRFFTDVYITSGTNNFKGATVVTEEDSVFELADANCLLTFALGATLSEGTVMDAGYGTIKSSADFEMGADTDLYLQYATVYNDNGVASLEGGVLNVASGNLVLSDTSACIHGEGISATPYGSVQLTLGGVQAASSNLAQYVETDFGWLTKLSDISVDGGLVAEYGYDSVADELTDLGSMVTNIDAAIVGLTNTLFYSVNSLGADSGAKAIRYSIAQMPDAVESAYEINMMNTEQVAARNTEFRSMNGFASSQPVQAGPTGAAGPDATPDESTVKGWVRAYASMGDHDASGAFAAYDVGTYGTVIGVDKSFGNLLLGLAGGYARSDLDSDAYDADVDTWHGTAYATYGWESVYVDLAGTYGHSDIDESSSISGSLVDSSSGFGADIVSGYIAAGKRFDLKETLSLVPQASFLGTYYSQDEFVREGPIYGDSGSATYKDYDSWSGLLSLGASLSTMHQIDWLNQGVAFIPEVRAFWLHEFNAEQDDMDVFLYGNLESFGVRAREEDLLRIGLGFDIWSWKHQNSKFEIDYDGILAPDYREHVFSGKITYSF
ncbi:autotransporter domain-containing protein [Pontiella sp.]|uniref:autotransporter family protein n=1 Tax=Pontiella sp. TaxID=2837462 RepID=UPI003563BE6A